MKNCAQCKHLKDLSDFPKNKSRKEGIGAYCKACVKSNYQKNKESHREACRAYYLANKDSIQKRHIKYNTERLKKDASFRAMFNARVRVNSFVRGQKGFSKSLGCSFGQFKSHIEGLFQLGMTWENYGQWQVDHRHPLSIAYKEGSESFKNACLYRNLEPMWAAENIKKGNRVI
jgi:hypothetical protein